MRWRRRARPVAPVWWASPVEWWQAWNEYGDDALAPLAVWFEPGVSTKHKGQKLRSYTVPEQMQQFAQVVGRHATAEHIRSVSRVPVGWSNMDVLGYASEGDNDVISQQCEREADPWWCSEDRLDELEVDEPAALARVAHQLGMIPGHCDAQTVSFYRRYLVRRALLGLPMVLVPPSDRVQVAQWWEQPEHNDDVAAMLGWPGGHQYWGKL